MKSLSILFIEFESPGKLTRSSIAIAIKLGVVYDKQRCNAYEGVESESRASRIKIYDTFDRSAVKIHRRAFVSCSRVKACVFCGFVNISSETFLGKLSPLNELRNFGDR